MANCWLFKNVCQLIQALTCLLKARDVDPTSAETLFNLGLVFASLHQYCSAAIHWKAAVVFTNKTNNFVDQEIMTLISACLNVITNDDGTNI